MALNDPARVRGFRRLIDVVFDEFDLRNPTMRVWVPVRDGYRSTELRSRTVDVLADVTATIDYRQLVSERRMLQQIALSPDDFLGGLDYLRRIGLLAVVHDREFPWLPLERWIGYGPFYLNAYVEGMVRAPLHATVYARQSRSQSS